MQRSEMLCLWMLQKPQNQLARISSRRLWFVRLDAWCAWICWFGVFIGIRVYSYSFISTATWSCSFQDTLVRLAIRFRTGGHCACGQREIKGAYWWIVFLGLSGKFQGSLQRYRGFTEVSLVGYGNTASRRFNLENHKMRKKFPCSSPEHKWESFRYFTWLSISEFPWFHMLILSVLAAESNKEKFVTSFSCTTTSPGKVIFRSRSLL